MRVEQPDPCLPPRQVQAKAIGVWHSAEKEVLLNLRRLLTDPTLMSIFRGPAQCLNSKATSTRKTARLVGLLAFLSTAGFAQTGQPCHSDPADPLYGLYCSAIKAAFTGVQGSATATTIINGSIVPITGTLTFLPGPSVRVGSQRVPSYDIGKWDIVIGYTHFVHVPRFHSVNAGQLEPAADNLSNSGCGRGYSNSFKTDSGNTLYYLCGDNLAADNQGLLVLIFPTEFLTGHLTQANLIATDTYTDSNGRTTVWESGLYLPPNSWAGSSPITPNGSTIGALAQNKPKRK